MKKIDFWTYDLEYKNYRKTLIKKIDNTLRKNELFFGDTLLTFEKNFLKINNSKYGLSVKNGTDALMLSLICAKVNPGDEVITVSLTAIPTVSAIVSVGAIPRFVDINDNLLIDENQIISKITNKTKAIIPVHLYGKVCNIEKIREISKRFNIKIIEDCAQAFLAKSTNINVGNFGDFGCFSFYPTKILGAYGDGGFIVCKKKEDLEKLKKLRFYGIEMTKNKSKFYKKYYSNIHGYNSRLDNIQATILNFKLKKIKYQIKKRLSIAKKYFEELKIKNCYNKNFVYHLFVIKVKNRNKLQKFLQKKGINSAIHYQTPLHKMIPYKKYVCSNCNCLPNTEKYSKKILSLPLYPELSLKKQDKIISTINSYFKLNNER